MCIRDRDHVDAVGDVDAVDAVEAGQATAAAPVTESAERPVAEGPAAKAGPEDDGEPTDAQAAEDEAAEDQPAAESGTEDRRGAPGRGGSRRRRGRRGRGKRHPRDDDQDDVADSAAADADEATPTTEEDAKKATGTTDEPSPDGAESTRLQSGRGRGRGRGGSGRATAKRGAAARGGPARGRRPVGAVSEETRRAITEGPPRRMLVTVGGERTQLAVLEQRTLVEHYVTRQEDISYVGNIYLGRVQNVLPGMEAAFVDIGKGRNGVLYAGEVDFDAADLDGGEVPRIEQTLKQGQTVLVQVTKDPMGTKGARLTQQLSIAGRYCVLAPGDGMLGISRKLPDDERERLRKLLKAIKPDQYGLIVRTAAEGATKEQLEADVARLVRIWEQVQERAASAKALESVYEEPGLVIRVIRDVFGPEYTDLIVDSPLLADQVRDYLSDVSPELVDRVAVAELDAGDGDEQQNLFDAYEVTNQIRRALEKKVWLPSGGYLIIEKTEAMWVIDVNTGKFVGKSNLEETVLRNNLEAADEIGRQLRLRDMGGIIVIDFVDMVVPANREEVLKRFRRELARDKTKSRVMEISKLGLVQMTRKNVSQGLQESFTTRCDVCDGRGARIVDHIV